MSNRSTLLIAFLLCSACFIFAQTPKTDNPTNSKIKIAFVGDDLRIERWQTDANAFQERGKALGAEVVLGDPNGKPEEQLRIVQKLLNQGIKALVFVPHDPNSAAEVIRVAKAKNVPVITYEAYALSGEDLFITTDFRTIGRLQVSTLTDRAPTGNYVILSGPASADKFHVAQLAALQPFLKDGRVKLIADLKAPDWTATQAYANMKQVLDSTKEKITAVVAVNDAIAGGAIQALEEQGLAGQVLVSGQDAELTAIIRVLMGTQTMTLYKPIIRQAEAAAEAAVKLARGEPVKPNGEYSEGGKSVPAIFFDPILVTKDNVKDTVIKNGFQKVEGIKEGLPKDKWSLIE